MITSWGEASLLFDKWRAEATPIYVVFVGPNHEGKFSFFEPVEAVNLPRVEFGSLASRISLDLQGASLRFSDLRQAPEDSWKPRAEDGDVLQAIFPNGAVCNFYQILS